MANKGISIEVFPPKKDEEFEHAYEVLEQLNELSPDFISVTYGAGGSRSKKTAELASFIQNQLKTEAIAHLTCVGLKKEVLLDTAHDLEIRNVKKILALRGDRPKDMTDEQFNARDFMYANEMIAFLHENTNMEIAAACYVEKHPESKSLDQDLDSLKLKQDAGASFLISQMFFDNNLLYDFLDKAQAKGITLPVHAGIMPITSAKQLGTSISLSGCSIPKSLADLFAKYENSPENMRKAGIDYAVKQMVDLKEHNVDIHLYSMNKPKLAAEILSQV